MPSHPLYAVVPAAGIGKRMQTDIPKQYLTINELPIIHYSIETLLQHDEIIKVIVVLSPEDRWFEELAIATHPKVQTVIGGVERADSVLSGLNILPAQGRVLVHDAARPCLTSADLDKLINAQRDSQGAILACEVRDTMKRSNSDDMIECTVPREKLFHALTPQLFDLIELRQALSEALQQGHSITDEASAMEWANHPVQLIIGRSDNIKVTRPEDLALAQLFLAQQGRFKGVDL